MHIAFSHQQSCLLLCKEAGSKLNYASLKMCFSVLSQWHQPTLLPQSGKCTTVNTEIPTDERNWEQELVGLGFFFLDYFAFLRSWL